MIRFVFALTAGGPTLQYLHASELKRPHPSGEACNSTFASNSSVREWLSFADKNPLEFTIQYPPRREYFQEKFREDKVTVIPDQGNPWLLYVHVPFCEKRCYFCNFAVDIRRNESIYSSYVTAVERELKRLDTSEASRQVVGIDIGGGTPTRLPIEHLERLLLAMKPFQASLTHKFGTSIETTPRIASEEPEKLVLLNSLGVKRISVGVQSFNSEHLDLVNRGLHKDMNAKAADNIHKIAFERFNIDLIFGLPKQSDAHWKEDLSRVIDLGPDSITTYDCLYRGKGRALTKTTECLPSLADYGRMYDIGYDFLTSNGYFAPYGSVNFSKLPTETGTSAYFEGRLLDGLPYLGVGNYSSSWVDNHWFFNTRGVNEYIRRSLAEESVVDDFYVLPPSELYAKYILFSLNYGFIDETRFRRRFGISFSEVFQHELDSALTQGWLQKAGDIWTIPYGQFKNMNRVRSLFYSEGARKWLQGLYQTEKDSEESRTVSFPAEPHD
jgi:oxygen-independent coproporphyrinogen-3 oxidase